MSGPVTWAILVTRFTVARSSDLAQRRSRRKDHSWRPTAHYLMAKLARRVPDPSR
jgi:hypothetical protein